MAHVSRLVVYSYIHWPAVFQSNTPDTKETSHHLGFGVVLANLAANA